MKKIIDEYGLEIPPKNLPLSNSFYNLYRAILKGQKIANENYENIRRASYYKLKAFLFSIGIKENPSYTEEKTSSVSKYIYEPN